MEYYNRKPLLITFATDISTFRYPIRRIFLKIFHAASKLRRIILKIKVTFSSALEIKCQSKSMLYATATLAPDIILDISGAMSDINGAFLPFVVKYDL